VARRRSQKRILPREVFLSHSHKDRRFTTRLSRTLRDHGVSVWYAEHNIEGAEQWHDEIGRALKRCDWFILVLTPDAVASKWVKHELTYALRTDRYDGHLIPLLRKSCDAEELSFALPALQMIDMRRSYERACRELLRIWGIAYRA